MGLREDLLPDILVIRNIAVDLGIRRYQVWLRLIDWDGARPGVGTESVTDTYLGRVKVRLKNTKDVVAGMSELTDGTYELGPFTPECFAQLPDTKSVDPSDLSPAQTGLSTEIYILVKGPGLPDEGILCRRVEDDTSKPFRYMVSVKNTGRKAA